MKLLFSYFYKHYARVLSFAILLQIIALSFICYFGSNKSIVILLFALSGPVYFFISGLPIFIMNIPFFHIISSAINAKFNRMTLILYFIISNMLLWILGFLARVLVLTLFATEMYSFKRTAYDVIVEVVSGDLIKNKSSDVVILYLVLSLFLFDILSNLFWLLMCSLSYQINAEKTKRVQHNYNIFDGLVLLLRKLKMFFFPSNYKDFVILMVILPAMIFMTVCIIGFHSLNIYLFLCFFVLIIYGTINLFMHRFKLRETRMVSHFKFAFFSIIYGLIVGFNLYQRSQLENESLSLLERVEVYNKCDFMCPKVALEKIPSYIASIEEYNTANYFSQILSKNYLPSDYLGYFDKKITMKGAIDGVQEAEFDEAEILKIYNILSAFYDKNSETFGADQEYSYSLYNNQKVSRNFINQLKSLNTDYSNFVSLILAKSSLKQDEFLEFYAQNKADFSKEVKKASPIRRYIATIKRK